MTRREVALTIALALLVGGLYLSQQYIGPLLSTAAIILIAGEALIEIIDDVFPREQRSTTDKPN